MTNSRVLLVVSLLVLALVLVGLTAGSLAAQLVAAFGIGATLALGAAWLAIPKHVRPMVQAAARSRLAR